MKKIISGLAASLIIVLLPATSRNEPFNIPPLPEDEVRESIIFYKEGKVGIEDMATSQQMLYWEAPSFLKHHVYWVGEGASRRPQLTLIEERHNETTATYTFYFKPGEHFILERFEVVVKDGSDKEVRREHHNLFHPMLEHPDDLTHVYTVEYALRGLDFTKPGSTRTFNIWLPPNTVVAMVAEVIGVENIELKDGTTWPCYRVEFGPDMVKLLGPILGRVIKPFIGDYTFWYDTRGTHPLIKYVGPMGKVNTGGVPTEVYETASISPHPEKAE